MKIKKFIKYFLCLISALIILGIGYTIYRAIPKKDNYFISNADFKDYDFLKNLSETNEDLFQNSEKYPAKAHELTQGHSIVLILRTYEDPHLLIIDDERYEKVTIAIDKSIFKEGIIKLPNKNVKAIYSDGASAWTSSGCHGYIKDGIIEIQKIDHNVTVQLNLRFTYKNFSGDNVGELCRKEFVANETFKEIAFSDLNPYFGLTAKYPYETTYRKPITPNHKL